MNPAQGNEDPIDPTEEARRLHQIHAKRARSPEPVLKTVKGHCGRDMPEVHRPGLQGTHWLRTDLNRHIDRIHVHGYAPESRKDFMVLRFTRGPGPYLYDHQRTPRPSSPDMDPDNLNSLFYALPDTTEPQQHLM